MRSKISTVLELAGFVVVGHVCFEAATWFGELVVGVSAIAGGYMLAAPPRGARAVAGDDE